MGRTPTEGIYFGDRKWHNDTGFTWVSPKHFQSRKWHLSSSNSIRLVQKITERVCSFPYDANVSGVSSAVFTADQYSGETQIAGNVIVKIFQRIPFIRRPKGKEYASPVDLFSHHLPISEDHPDDVPEGYQKERDSLQLLTDRNCAHAPSLVTSFTEHSANVWVKGGFLGFLVIEKLAALNVSDIWEHSPSSEAQLNEQLIIQERFKAAYTDIRNLGVYNTDTASSNLMWNSKLRTCYFIDFEMAMMEEPPPTPKTCEEWIARSRHRFVKFSEWDIIMDFQEAELDEAIDLQHRNGG